jgi:outer membrane protein
MHGLEYRCERRLRRWSWLLATALIFAVAFEAGFEGCSRAQSATSAPAPRRILLAQALQIASEHNRMLKAASLKRRSAVDQVTEARAALLPRLDALENYSYTDNPPLVFSNLLAQQEFTAADFALSRLNFPAALSNFQSQIMMSQTLFAGGSVWAAYKAAGYQADAQTWQATRVRQEVQFAVIQAYYRALLAEQEAQVIERALAAARAHRDRARNMLKQGMVVSADLLRSQVVVGSLRQQLVSAQSLIEIARAQLSDTLGVDERLAPLGAQMPATLKPRGLAELREAALRHRPEVKIAYDRIKAAEQAVTIARAGYLPTVSLATTYENDSEELIRAGNNYSVFVFARFNLFNGFATRAKADAAQSDLERAIVLRAQLLQDISVEVERAYRTLEAARENLAVAERDNAYAADALRILENRYGAGLATNVDVLDAQASRRAAESRSVRAKVEVAVDFAVLDLAVGQAPSGLE